MSNDDDRTLIMPAPGAPLPERHRSSPLARLARAVALIALLMVAVGGPGYRFGLWHFRTGFDLMAWAAKYVGPAAIVLALVAMLAALLTRRRGLGMALVALVLAGLAIFLPWNWRRGAGDVPPIHDITTDTDNPPPFRALVAVRERDNATNPWAYEGDSIARLQREAYPDVRPVWLPMPPDSAYGVAYRAAEGMGWEIVDGSPEEGRIEATDVTQWFGFRDDVVIRVMPSSGISRVDVRSVSRVGRSDMGLNAKRIRSYLRVLKEEHGALERE
jgi:hypothetical protein